MCDVGATVRVGVGDVRVLLGCGWVEWRGGGGVGVGEEAIWGSFRPAKCVDSAAQPPKVLYPPRRYIGTATREPDSAGLRYWEDMQN